MTKAQSEGNRCPPPKVEGVIMDERLDQRSSEACKITGLLPTAKGVLYPLLNAGTMVMLHGCPADKMKHSPGAVGEVFSYEPWLFGAKIGKLRN